MTMSLAHRSPAEALFSLCFEKVNDAMAPEPSVTQQAAQSWDALHVYWVEVRMEDSRDSWL